MENELFGETEKLFSWIEKTPYHETPLIRSHRAHSIGGQEVSISVPCNVAGVAELTKQATGADQLRSSYLSYFSIHVPVTHWQLTTSTMVVQEYRAGLPMDASILRAHGYRPRAIAHTITQIFFPLFRGEDVLYLHHPERVLSILPGGRLFLHDTNAILELNQQLRNTLGRALGAVSANDLDTLLRVAPELFSERGSSNRYDLEQFVAHVFHRHRDGYTRLCALATEGEKQGYAMDRAPRNFVDSLTALSNICCTLDSSLDVSWLFKQIARGSLSQSLTRSLHAAPRGIFS